VATYFVDKETTVPWWAFLAFSMVFSRLHFRRLKGRKAEALTDATQ